MGKNHGRAQGGLMTFTLELTEEELKFIHDRCSRKAARLEEAGLTDIPCYRLSWQVMTKIYKLETELQNLKIINK
jgi:hypothetical protein